MIRVRLVLAIRLKEREVGTLDLPRPGLLTFAEFFAGLGFPRAGADEMWAFAGVAAGRVGAPGLPQGEGRTLDFKVRGFQVVGDGVMSGSFFGRNIVRGGLLSAVCFVCVSLFKGWESEGLI